MSVLRSNRRRSAKNCRAASERGQSLVEALIACTFVLIPLYLAVPLLGKYLDIKQAAVQAARYEAWEYTVWQDSNDSASGTIRSNFKSVARGRQPYKQPLVTHLESENRFFGHVGTEPNEIGRIQSNAGTTPIRLTAATVNPLWRDHRRAHLFSGGSVRTGDTDASTPTLKLFGLDIGSLMSTALDVIDTFFGLVSTVFKFLGEKDAAFTAINTDGMVNANLSLPVRVHDQFISTRRTLDTTAKGADRSTLDFTASAAVLSEGWNAGGTVHTYDQVNGTTPVTILRALLETPVLDPIWDTLAIFAPELTECTSRNDPKPPLGKKIAKGIGLGVIYDTFVPENGSLWLGYVDSDVVHADRLSADPKKPGKRLGSHVCGADGRCVWDSGAMAYADPGRGRITPLSHTKCEDNN